MEEAARRERLLRVVVQHEVLGERELEHEPAAVPVLGDVADAVLEELVRARRASGRGRRRAIAPCSTAAQAGDRVDQLGLPVAVDAGDRDDLAGAHLERDAAHRLEAAVVDDVQVLDLEQRLARRRAFGLSTRSSTSRPTIIRARLASVAPSRGIVSTFLPRRRTVTRSAISSTSFSLCEMKMTDMPSATRLLRISKSSIASCGVSTAVGSSRMRMSALR